MLDQYDGRMVRIRDHSGRNYTGTADVLTEEDAFQEYGRKEEAIRINGALLYAGDIASVEEKEALSVIRAVETWQRAGAYYVRIQAMAKKHHITLRQEFDAHDTPDTRYIVVTDRDFPVATARLYPIDACRMMIGRVVVLPEYRRQGIGRMVVSACEDWAKELHFRSAVLESRDNKVGFYEQMGYSVCAKPVEGETFCCIRMEKKLS